MTLYRIGCAIVVTDVVLYFVSIVLVSAIDPLTVKLRVAAWCFLIGSLLALISTTTVLFGYGWKRLVAFVPLASLPFWYGFTLY
jgi:hypothetical protein